MLRLVLHNLFRNLIPNRKGDFCAPIIYDKKKFRTISSSARPWLTFPSLISWLLCVLAPLQKSSAPLVTANGRNGNLPSLDGGRFSEGELLLKVRGLTTTPQACTAAFFSFCVVCVFACFLGFKRFCVSRDGRRDALLRLPHHSGLPGLPPGEAAALDGPRSPQLVKPDVSFAGCNSRAPSLGRLCNGGFHSDSNSHLSVRLAQGNPSSADNRRLCGVVMLSVTQSVLRRIHPKAC